MSAPPPDHGLDALCLTLALMEKLTDKKQSYGAVRAREPLLSKADVEAILKGQQTKLEEFRRAEAEQASRLVLPPGARA